MAQALKSPRDPAWTADGVTSPTWLPVSPVSGRLDAFEWKAPALQLATQVEDGHLSADEAIRSLPPVMAEHHPVAHGTAPAKPVVDTPVIIEAAAETPRERTEPIKVAEAKRPAPIVEKTREKDGASNGEPVADPFFGRPPDDPGVREPAVGKKVSEKTTFRLF